MGAFRLPFSGGLKDARRLDPRERLFLFVVAGTIPIVFLGLFGRKYVVQLFGSTTMVCFNLLITGTFLWFTRYAATLRPRSLERMGIRDALIIGLAQSFALMPGISRSGATISAGIYLGLDRELTGKFSFLLFTPAVIGAIILESAHITLSDIQLVPTLLGLLFGAVVGYVALTVLLKLVRRGNLHVFAPYCWLVGVVGLAVHFLV
jgi:undecaprenyl-diphosphatase